MRGFMAVAILSAASMATATPRFSPSILVDRTSGPAPLLVTIDMCASDGEELRFAWDYDGDGIDDQRGPCRRTITVPSGAHIIRVSIWEAVSADRGRHEESIFAFAEHSDPAYPPYLEPDGGGPGPTYGDAPPGGPCGLSPCPGPTS